MALNETQLAFIRAKLSPDRWTKFQKMDEERQWLVYTHYADLEQLGAEVEQHQKNAEQHQKNAEQLEREIAQGEREIAQGEREIAQGEREIAQGEREAARLHKEVLALSDTAANIVSAAMRFSAEEAERLRLGARADTEARLAAETNTKGKQVTVTAQKPGSSHSDASDESVSFHSAAAPGYVADGHGGYHPPETHGDYVALSGDSQQSCCVML